MRIAIVGAGNVGGSVAMHMAVNHIGGITLFDKDEGRALGKALDISQATGVYVRGTSDPIFLVDSDVVIVAAGRPREPGMSRNDLLQINAEIIEPIARDVGRYAPNAIVIVITNPVDVMAYHFWMVSGMRTRQITGLSGMLDTKRFEYNIAAALGTSTTQVSGACVIGSHTEKMVPLPRIVYVKGKPLNQWLTKNEIENVVAKTQNGGAEIVALLKSGAAHYAPAVAVMQQMHALINMNGSAMICSTHLNDGRRSYFSGRPVFTTWGIGAEQGLELTSEERKLLRESDREVIRAIAELHG